MLHETPGAASATNAPASEVQAGHGGGNFWILALGSIGVVFGDIGTSPLYALQTALGQFKSTGLGQLEVVGTVSLIVWALLIVVTAKYVVFLMQADNKGEGGILSLDALARTALGKHTGAVFLLGVAGAALFSGDAVITPAISVLSALEGLKQIDARLTTYVLPATIVILLGLFFAQSRGTAGVAAFFGPIMLVFFAVNTVLGLLQIPHAWVILSALSPLPGLKFLWVHGAMGFVVLGSVFLAVTGAEALYADMGHFGRRPIQVSWLFIVLPALIINYLGQGALILSDPKAVESSFYQLAPSWGDPPPKKL
jgi:KUP system potassium uptake protein